MKNINLLALLVVIVAGVLVFTGKIEATAFLTLVTGLAIPARADGYQSVGTGPQRVIVDQPPDQPVPVNDTAAAADNDAEAPEGPAGLLG